MEDRELAKSAYCRMYDGMLEKNEKTLREVLADSFVLVHITGLKQNREEFIEAVLNGTLNYYSAEHESITVEINGEVATLIGRSYVSAAVFGGSRNFWRLQQRCSLKIAAGGWEITRSVAGIY